MDPKQNIAIQQLDFKNSDDKMDLVSYESNVVCEIQRVACIKIYIYIYTYIYICLSLNIN